MSLETADQLSLPRDPAAAMEAATKQYVDALVAAQTGTAHYDGGDALSVYTLAQHTFDGGASNG